MPGMPSCTSGRHRRGGVLGACQAALLGRVRQPKAHPGSLAEQALQRIAALYEIEADIRGHTAHERRRQRLERAAPLLQQLRVAEAACGCRRSPTWLAIGYTLTRWRSLTRYCEDGRIEIDNNAAERALRGSLGRKNYCSRVRTPGNGLRPSTAWWKQPSSTAWTRRRTCARCSRAHRRSSDQPHRAVAAMEHGAGQRARCTTQGGLSMATKVHRLSKAPGKAPSATLQLHIELRGTQAEDMAPVRYRRRSRWPGCITSSRPRSAGAAGICTSSWLAQRYGTADPSTTCPARCKASAPG